MLQQTQVNRVCEFFIQWMKKFPSIEALAAATEEEVMKAWEGLGYYSRARSLHRAARRIVEVHSGSIPDNRQQLQDIPGIGPYTSGAILAFAFHRRAVAIDANVKRVVCRLYNVQLAFGELEAAVDRLLSRTVPWHTMEALIELGALVCRSSPHCEACPIASFCQARARGNQKNLLPKRSSLTTALWRDVALLLHGQNILVVRRRGKQMMSGLCEFPFFDTVKQGRSPEEFTAFLRERLTPKLQYHSSLPSTTHAFTRYRVTLFPHLFSIDAPVDYPDGAWVDMKAVSQLPFSSGHRRLLDAVFCHVRSPETVIAL